MDEKNVNRFVNFTIPKRVITRRASLSIDFLLVLGLACWTLCSEALADKWLSCLLWLNFVWIEFSVFSFLFGNEIQVACCGKKIFIIPKGWSYSSRAYGQWALELCRDPDVARTIFAFLCHFCEFSLLCIIYNWYRWCMQRRCCDVWAKHLQKVIQIKAFVLMVFITNHESWSIMFIFIFCICWVLL